MNPIDSERFESYRPLMFSIAYRMLGSITDAEDMVQQAYLRYQSAVSDEIVSHKAFLSTVITRLCLNHLQSAHVQRESYMGTWLPEPALTAQDERFLPTQQAELHESLSLAFLSLLQNLTPDERAVFLLREVFDYDYAEIAAIVGKTEAACRQVLSRAKKHIAVHRPRFKPTPESHRQLLNQFIQTIERGELEALVQLLSDDVVMWADGGGKVRGAIIHPLYGREAVGRFLLVSAHFIPESDRTSSIMEVNGEPALVVQAGGEVRIILSVSFDAGRVCGIRVIGNPDKLKWVNQTMGDSEEHEA
jgi:RNA polymerase sigma-70 factor (ECF subfamily)